MAKKEKRYYRTWRNKFLTTEAKTIGDMVQGLEDALEELKAMRNKGVTLDGGAGDDYANLVTTNPKVAEEFEMEEEHFEEDED